MNRPEIIFVFGVSVMALLPAGERAAAQAPESDAAATAVDSLEAWIWLDRGEEPVVVPGEEVRVYYRVSDDAYVAVFRIDTEGRVSMLFPQHPGAETRTSGERDYRLLLPESRTWDVSDAPGEGAFFVVASRDPLDFSLFDFDDEEGWDLTTVGAEAYDDSYEAIDDHVLAILPTWETAAYALDLLPYEVAEEVADARPADEVIVLRSGRRVRYLPPASRVAYVPARSGPHVRLFLRFGPLPGFGARVHYGPAPIRYRTPRYRAPRYRAPRYAPAPRPRPGYRAPSAPRYVPPVRTPRRGGAAPARRSGVGRVPGPVRAPSRPAATPSRPRAPAAAPSRPPASRPAPARTPAPRRPARVNRRGGGPVV